MKSFLDYLTIVLFQSSLYTDPRFKDSCPLAHRRRYTVVSVSAYATRIRTCNHRSNVTCSEEQIGGERQRRHMNDLLFKLD